MRKFLVSLSLVSAFASHAQHAPYKFAVSISPFALIQVEPTLMLGVEYRRSRDISFCVDGGYIMASGYLLRSGVAGENTNGVSGFTIRPSIKYFINEKKNFYLQPQLLYKQVMHQRYDWLGKEPVNGVATYERLEHFRYRRRIYGLNLMAGAMVALSKKTNSAYFDFYFGFGVRKKTATVLDAGGSTYQTQTLIGNTATADHSMYPSVPAGMRVIIPL
jgi:hypothetical protein